MLNICFEGVEVLAATTAKVSCLFLSRELRTDTILNDPLVPGFSDPQAKFKIGAFGAPASGSQRKIGSLALCYH